MGTIYWVDEDEGHFRPERRFLVGLGYKLETLDNASDAFDILQLIEPNKVDFIILDVMLRQGRDEKFNDTNTLAGLDTGIVLATALYKLNKHWGKKILFFSKATQVSHVSRIRANANKLGALYMPKAPGNIGRKFLHRLIEFDLIPKPEQR